MQFNDQLDFVMQHIKKNKLRVFMTVLATTMGCAFLIILASVGFGMQKTIVDDVLSNENVTSITMYTEQGLEEKEMNELESMKHVQNVLPETTVNANANYTFEDRTSTGNIRLTDFKKYENVKEPLAEGTYPKAENEVVVGYNFAQMLLTEKEKEIIEQKQKEAEKNGTWYEGEDEGYKQSIIGKEFQLTLSSYDSTDNESEVVTYKVVGIMTEPTYEWLTDNRVYMDQEAAAKIQALYDSVKPETEVDPIMSTSYTIYAEQLMYVEGLLKQLRDKGYSVYSVTEELDQINKVFSIIKIGLIFVGTIAVLIASIGIFNTMTMAVTERTREIGVMKAIGANPKLILKLFLMESAFIGLFGTALAIIISYGISFVVNALFPIILEAAFEESNGADLIFSYIPWELVVASAVISIGVAVISGIRPAKKATKIEVMQALRQEL